MPGIPFTLVRTASGLQPDPFLQFFQDGRYWNEYLRERHRDEQKRPHLRETFLLRPLFSTHPPGENFFFWGVLFWRVGLGCGGGGGGSERGGVSLPRNPPRRGGGQKKKGYYPAPWRAAPNNKRGGSQAGPFPSGSLHNQPGGRRSGAAGGLVRLGKGGENRATSASTAPSSCARTGRCARVGRCRPRRPRC